MNLSRYPPEESRSSYVQYVRFGRLMKIVPDVLPLFESVKEGGEDGKELRILHLDSEMLHGSRESFVIALNDAPYF